MSYSESFYFVLAAHGGFTLLQASQIRPKSTTAAIVGNLLSLAWACIAFWGCGYAFAVGDGTTSASNFFLSHTRFFLIDATSLDHSRWVMEFIYAGLVVVIMNGGFVARLRFWVYPVFAVLMAGFLYPCARHWGVHPEGWLMNGIDVTNNGVEENIVYIDYGGAGSIHVMAGSAALISTVLLSPRKDRVEARKFRAIGGQITPLMLVGGLLALLGLIAKNLTVSNGVGLVNSLLSAHASAAVSFALKRSRRLGDSSSTKALINGALAGVVGVSCAPHLYYSYGGFVIGVVSGLTYVAWSTLLQVCRVDDPTDAVSVHLGCGLWALLAGPLFIMTKPTRINTSMTTGTYQMGVGSPETSLVTGIFYDGARRGFQTFGWNMLGGVAIFVWSGMTMFVLLLGFVIARIATYKDDDVNAVGLDIYEHNEPAYPDRADYMHEDKNVLDYIWDDRADLPYFDVARVPAAGSKNGRYEPNRASRKGNAPSQASTSVPVVTLEERNYQQWREHGGRY